jgi:serine O-acetyltransferase
VQIDANTVVVRDIPAGAVATGVPAKVRFPHKGEEPYELMFKDPALWI